MPSGSGREVVPVLNLKNGANDVVRPRSPRYFLSNQSDSSHYIETINCNDCWNYFFSDHSDRMETKLNKVEQKVALGQENVKAQAGIQVFFKPSLVSKCYMSYTRGNKARHPCCFHSLLIL